MVLLSVTTNVTVSVGQWGIPIPLMLSIDETMLYHVFPFQKFYGLYNPLPIVPQLIDPPVFTDTVRITMLEYYYFPCMRFDLRSCPGMYPL